ncbi:MAG: tRNA uridine-5-carboxymethylaminomethyl(34) synthesis GTPase MnmE [Firmicutes bacterium]|nr:tRNA uridine-5-carboxymethylaminomethyl(34) synthesis GTPase MnmE [Bacillota bacterium]
MEETICAIATPPGEGGIGIVRISGPMARPIMDRVFVPAKAGEIVPRMLTYGHVFDGDTAVDEVLAVYMPGPGTYTAEDVVEIDCHGGSVPLYRTLKLVMASGARLAEPGEFTKRAFLNGRIDLSQAEAVMDVVGARTEEALEIAVARLRGKFSEEIGALRSALTDVLVEIDVNIDYPDEDVEEAEAGKIAEELGKIKASIDDLIASARTGRIMKEGLSVAIVGRPNVGKSSLLNGLLRESRAIVTEIPGTTRDTIEEFANIGGIPVKLTDTAGVIPRMWSRRSG